MKPFSLVFYRKSAVSRSSSNWNDVPGVSEPTLIKQNAKTVKEMNFGNPTTRFTKNTTDVNFIARYRSIRLIMVTTLVSFFINISLSSCSQPDTIAPDSTVGAEEARLMAPSVLNADNFEGRKFNSFWIPELRTPTAGQLTTEQARTGKQAMRFSWKPSQYDGTNPTMHSELATAPLTNGETERWYGYSIYMPSRAMADDNETIVFCQWHGIPDPGFEDTIPPLAFYLEGGNQVKVYYRASNKPIKTLLQVPTSQKILRFGKATYDKWVDYVVHVKWDPTGKTGVLQIWQDGVLKADEQNISIGYPQQRKPYWKVGIYAWTGKSKYNERILFYDDVRIGGPTANYDAVKPGQASNSAR